MEYIFILDGLRFVFIILFLCWLDVGVLVAAFIIANCIGLMLYFYDVIRLDFYYILSGAIVATIAFTAGYHEAKKKYGS